MYRITFTSVFQTDIKKLDRVTAERIVEKVKYLASHPQLLRFSVAYTPADLAKLQKYRVGDWRVFFWVDHEEKEITLYSVEHRREQYKRFRKR